jgi:dephospho-CoA kinase
MIILKDRKKEANEQGKNQRKKKEDREYFWERGKLHIFFRKRVIPIHRESEINSKRVWERESESEKENRKRILNKWV